LYTVKKLADLAGVIARTLRYYDKVGLLPPSSLSPSGYQLYGPGEVDRLQMILFYRELGMPLEEILKAVTAPEYNASSALAGHLKALIERRGQLDRLIANVEKTIKSKMEELTMNDTEKFDGFIKGMIDKNEALYGAEIREKYGSEAVDKSYAQMRSRGMKGHEKAESLALQVNAALKAAFPTGDPAGALAQRACELHKQWLCCYWDTYSSEAHKGLAKTYVDDPRFTAYYDAIAKGCAVFLRDAINVYCKA
jgi:DNA-binding transcriptional MerR regulator